MLVHSHPFRLNGVVASWQRRTSGKRKRLTAHLNKPSVVVDVSSSGQIDVAKSRRSGAHRRVAGGSCRPILSDHGYLQNQRQHIDRAEGDYWTNRVLRHPFHEGWVV